MGKKGKKSGGSSGSKKKKGGKKKKSAEPQMTWREALLAYQINIKERAMEDMKYEYKALLEKNQRHKERNERLHAEQLVHMQNLLKQAKEFDKKLEGVTGVDKKVVITVMMDNWEAQRAEEKEVAELKEQIARKEAEIVTEQREVKYWTEYKDAGQHDHSKQIQLLEHELEDMQASFNEMSAHLERALNQAKDEIKEHTDETLDKQKYLATEKAMVKMDKYSRQEVKDNDWLKKEVEIHKRDAEHLIEEVETLEKSNLQFIADLFECTVDDLKISRNFYLTQFEDQENIDETGILEMDLSKLSLHSNKPDIGFEDEKPGRPKSAIQRYVEDKVANIQTSQEDMGDEGSEYNGELDPEGSEDGDPYNNYYHFDDEDFDDYLKLGPLELKLLSISGTRKPIYDVAKPSQEMVESKKVNPDQWPVTKPMLKEAVTPRK